MSLPTAKSRHRRSRRAGSRGGWLGGWLGGWPGGWLGSGALALTILALITVAAMNRANRKEMPPRESVFVAASDAIAGISDSGRPSDRLLDVEGGIASASSASAPRKHQASATAGFAVSTADDAPPTAATGVDATRSVRSIDADGDHDSNSDAPSRTSRAISRVANAIGVDRLGELTGGFVGADVNEGRIRFEFDTDAPARNARRLLAGVRQLTVDAAKQAAAIVTGRPTILLRIVDHDGETTIPLDGDGRLAVADSKRSTDGSATIAAESLTSEAGSKHGTAVPDPPAGSEEVARSVLGSSVVLLVQGERDAESNCAWSAMAPALVDAGHRVVVLDELTGESSTNRVARIATLLAALDEIGVRRVDVVAQREGGVALQRLVAGGDRSDAPTTGAHLLRRVVIVQSCAVEQPTAVATLSSRLSRTAVDSGSASGSNWGVGPVELLRIVAVSRGGGPEDAVAINRVRWPESIPTPLSTPNPGATIEAILSILSEPEPARTDVTHRELSELGAWDFSAAEGALPHLAADCRADSDLHRQP